MFSFMKYFLILCVLNIGHINCFDNDNNNCKSDEDDGSDFPSNFEFGVSTAAYQIEGAWNLDGKGPSIWDIFTHQYPNRIADKSNGDIGPDSYHQFHQDLDALKNLGVQFYRFSISWNRILSNGDRSSLNRAGIDYYNKVINQLLENNIQPMVTMFHYDLPNELQKIGGFTNPLFIEYFKEYAKVLYENFGDRVKYWITFNEPYDYCLPGYATANYPPVIDASGIADYLCIDHTIKAHAVAYRLYRDKFYNKYHGKIGITLSTRYYFSKTNDTEWINRGMQFGFGWLAHPIFSKTGGYPQIMIDVVGNNSKNEGRPWSRLPEMSDYWKNIICGAGDFIGLNYYTSRLIEKRDKLTVKIPSWEYDAGFVATIDPSWKRAKSEWLYSVPDGLEQLLKWIKNEYDNAEVIITENGWSDDGQLDDDDRIEYLKVHLKAVSNAIKDGCNVTGHTTWSLIDNFEWLKGYTEKFGLYYVNLTSPNKDRIPKKSVDFMKNIIKTRKLSSITGDNGNYQKSVIIM